MIALADVFEVPPLILMFPIGVEETIEYLPSRTFDTWSAVKLFTGEAYEAGRENTHYAVPLYLFRRHEALVAEWFQAAFLPQVRRSNDEDDRRDPGGVYRLAAVQARIEQELLLNRAEMRRHGLTPPRLDPRLEHIEAPGYTFSTHPRLEGRDDEPYRSVEEMFGGYRDGAYSVDPVEPPAKHGDDV